MVNSENGSNKYTICGARLTNLIRKLCPMLSKYTKKVKFESFRGQIGNISNTGEFCMRHIAT